MECIFINRNKAKNDFWNMVLWNLSTEFTGRHWCVGNSLNNQKAVSQYNHLLKTLPIHTHKTLNFNNRNNLSAPAKLGTPRCFACARSYGSVGLRPPSRAVARRPPALAYVRTTQPVKTHYILFLTMDYIIRITIKLYC